MRPEDYRYQIQNEPNYFITGKNADGDQFLIGVALPEILVIRFDADGIYQEHFKRELSEGARPVWTGFWSADHKLLDAEQERCAVELGVTPSTISVRRFFLTKEAIGIEDLPNHYREVLDNPDEVPDYLNSLEEVKEELDEIKRWLEDGEFVLYWFNDYWLNREGEVTSS